MQLSPYLGGQGGGMASSKHIVHSLPWIQRCFQLVNSRDDAFAEEAGVSKCEYDMGISYIIDICEYV